MDGFNDGRTYLIFCNVITGCTDTSFSFNFLMYLLLMAHLYCKNIICFSDTFSFSLLLGISLFVSFVLFTSFSNVSLIITYLLLLFGLTSLVPSIWGLDFIMLRLDSLSPLASIYSKICAQIEISKIFVDVVDPLFLLTSSWYFTNNFK